MRVRIPVRRDAMFHNAFASSLSSNLVRMLVITAGTLGAAVHAQAKENPPLSAAVIDGVSIYSPADLFAVYRAQLGQPISSASAQAIVDQIEAMYLRDGYSRPLFRLRSDLVDDGVLRIEVFEPQLSDVILQGDAGPYAATLAELFDEVRSQRPLKAAQVQRTLQRMRELPGLEFRASTRADETRRNSYALVIDAQFQRIDGSAQMTNRGTREIGPKFVLGQLVMNNALGQNERLGLLFSAATDYAEYHGGGMFIDLPLGDEGVRLAATGFASRSDPSERPDRSDVYDRDRTSVRLVQPLAARDGLTVAMSVGLDVDNLEIVRNETVLRTERLRVLETGLRVPGRYSGANQYLLAVQLRHGLDAFGSELEALDLRRDPRREDFLLVRMQYTQLLRVADRWSMRLDALGQHSAYVLPDAERYKIGGERLGRGFEVTEIAGDQGIGAKVEMRRDLSVAARPGTRTSVYGFYDFGAAWKQDRSGRESAATSGVGVEIEIGRFNGYLEVAKPLTHADVEGDRATKFFAELNVKI